MCFLLELLCSENCLLLWPVSVFLWGSLVIPSVVLCTCDGIRLVPINSSGVGGMDPGSRGWGIRKLVNVSLPHKITLWNVIRYPQALRRQGGEALARGNVVFACFSATHKHMLLLCLDSTPQGACQRLGLLQLWAQALFQGKGREKARANSRSSFCFILTAQLSVSCSSHPAQHTSSNQVSVRVFLAVWYLSSFAS